MDSPEATLRANPGQARDHDGQSREDPACVSGLPLSHSGDSRECQSTLPLALPERISLAKDRPETAPGNPCPVASPTDDSRPVTVPKTSEGRRQDPIHVPDAPPAQALQEDAAAEEVTVAAVDNRVA